MTSGVHKRAGTPEEGDLRDLCTFCAEIEGRDEHNLLRRLLGPDVGDSYLLAQTENFVLIPGVGALMPGYLLAVPRRHVLSFGHLPERLAPEMDELLARAQGWIHRTYERGTLMFEHGPASFVERGGSCTDHAHLHVVPCPPGVDLLPGLRRDFEVRSSGTVLAQYRRADSLRPGPLPLPASAFGGCLHL